MAACRRDPAKKPSMSYIALISLAIQDSRRGRRTLSQIYAWLAAAFPYFAAGDDSWRNSVRHNLSLNECFVKNGRDERAKCSYWSIHPANAADFARGDFRRRQARLRVRESDVTRPLTSRRPVDVCPTRYVPMKTLRAPTAVLVALFGEAAILTEAEMRSTADMRRRAGGGVPTGVKATTTWTERCRAFQPAAVCSQPLCALTSECFYRNKDGRNKFNFANPAGMYGQPIAGTI